MVCVQQMMFASDGSDSVGVHRERTYVCDYPNCSKSFLRNNHLRRHQNEKHGRMKIVRSGQFRVRQLIGDT